MKFRALSIAVLLAACSAGSGVAEEMTRDNDAVVTERVQEVTTSDCLVYSKRYGLLEGTVVTVTDVSVMIRAPDGFMISLVPEEFGGVDCSPSVVGRYKTSVMGGSGIYQFGGRTYLQGAWSSHSLYSLSRELIASQPKDRQLLRHGGRFQRSRIAGQVLYWTGFTLVDAGITAALSLLSFGTSKSSLIGSDQVAFGVSISVCAAFLGVTLLSQAKSRLSELPSTLVDYYNEMYRGP